MNTGGCFGCWGIGTALREEAVFLVYGRPDDAAEDGYFLSGNGLNGAIAPQGINIYGIPYVEFFWPFTFSFQFILWNTHSVDAAAYFADMGIESFSVHLGCCLLQVFNDVLRLYTKVSLDAFSFFSGLIQNFPSLFKENVAFLLQIIPQFFCFFYHG